jgi:hypothetical protein
MGVIIFIAVLFFLGSGGMVIWLLFFYLAHNKVKKNHAAREAELSPDSPELSEEEMTRKLGAIRVWDIAAKLSTPLCVLAIVSVFALYIVYSIDAPIPTGDIPGKILLPCGSMLIAGLVLAGVSSRALTALIRSMGAALTLPTIREVFDVDSYRPFGHVEQDAIASSGLVDNWEGVVGSDCVEGRYRGVPILFSDVKLQHTYHVYHSDGSHLKTDTIFGGQWLVCDLGRELAADVRLIEREKPAKNHAEPASDVETENAAFNEKYRIVTEDGEAALRLLTPGLMNRLLAVGELAGADTSFCFQGGKVHIALKNWRDSFQLAGVKLKNMDDARRVFHADLAYMTAILDELLLSESLFR